jgi:hypothetical protein
MSGMNRQLFLFCLGAYTFLNLKGHHHFKYICKTSFSVKDYTNNLCRINVAPAANFVSLCANFNYLIYTGK